MRQTIPVIMRNEDGGGEATGQPTYLLLALTHIHLTIILLLKLLLYGPSLSPLTLRRYVLANIALTWPVKQIASEERMVKFDTDAKPIGVDNRCSACISPHIEDFIGPLEDTNKTIKGFTGA